MPHSSDEEDGGSYSDDDMPLPIPVEEQTSKTVRELHELESALEKDKSVRGGDANESSETA